MANKDKKEKIINADNFEDKLIDPVESNLDEEEILDVMKSRFDNCVEYYNDLYLEMKEDFRFRKGDQWDPADKQARLSKGRPAEVMNQLGQFVKKVVNDQKNSRPEINVISADSNANFRTTEIYQNIIKSIQVNSFADNAYDTAFDCASSAGLGFFRITPKFDDPMSFDQNLFIEPIDNPLSVYIDPDFDSNFDNIDYVFITTTLSKEEFEDKYPDSESYNEFACDGEWLNKDSVRIVEYFYRERNTKKIFLLENGVTIKEEDYNKLSNKPDIKKERKAEFITIHWIKSNGVEILEKTIFPGTRIPVIPVFGDIFPDGEGKKYFQGVIRQAKAAQKKYNYAQNTEIELIAAGNRSQWVAAKGQTEKNRAKWMNPTYQGILEYDPIDIGGNAVPPPQKQPFLGDITPVINAKQGAMEDLKSTTGIYDPSLGKGNTGERSGIAVIAKQRQSETNNLLFCDNLAKSLKLAGKILVDIIPYYYDNDRIIRIYNKNDPKKDEMIRIGDDPDIDFSFGKYDVTVTIGPYGQTQKADAIESISTLMTINPELANLVADIYFSNMDFKGAQDIAERLRKMLPAAVKDDASPEIPQEIQQQVAEAEANYQQQIAQLQTTAQNMQVLISQLTSELNDEKNKNYNKQLDNETKIAINARDNLTKLAIEELKQKGYLANMSVEEQMQFLQQQQLFNNVGQYPNAQSVTLPGVNDPVTVSSQTSPQQAYQQQQSEQDDRDSIINDIQQQLTAPRGNFR